MREATRVSDAWIVKRRPRRASAMRRHRFVEAKVAAARAVGAFPGAVMPEPEGSRERLVSTAASILLHGGLILLLVLLARLAQKELVEETIQITLPKQANEEPAAPRPKAIAESMARFAPAPMAMPPQVINPTVIQPRVADVQAAQVQVADLQPVQAPKQIAPIQAPEVAQVRTFQSPIVANSAAPKIVDPGAAQLSGPVDFKAPTGTLSGPRQVTNGGNTVGVADPSALGTGSSVQEGIASNRDVHGGKTGERASVNVAVGGNGGRGTGGNGNGPGGVSFEDCTSRPEVRAYMAGVRERVLSRWRSSPSGLPDGVFKVSLSFRLDPSGSASEISFISGDNKAVGASTVEAMRASSPFDQMPDPVRCLAGDRLTATFTLENLATN
jgi:hypothetical protein